ncbi:hypothetical protein ACWC2K_32785 [Streptomyces chattanoogensis]
MNDHSEVDPDAGVQPVCSAVASDFRRTARRRAAIGADTREFYGVPDGGESACPGYTGSPFLHRHGVERQADAAFGTGTLAEEPLAVRIPYDVGAACFGEGAERAVNRGKADR